MLERALKNQVGAARLRQWRSATPTLLIVDAQSVKNTDTAGLKGYDAGEKVSGIKRHIAVDTLGLPHGVAVTTAVGADRKVSHKEWREWISPDIEYIEQCPGLPIPTD